jgi:hypothetical protein
MTERPILFSAPMVLAILEGRKTMTRRIVKPQPPPGCSIHYMLGNESWIEEKSRTPLRHIWEAWAGTLFESRPDKYLCGLHEVRCPYGKPGDRLYVKETHWRLGKWVKDGISKTGRQRWRFKATKGEYVRFVPPDKKPAREEHGWHKRPSLFMPRWASRITLEITDVRVERLQEISDKDAQAEGVQPWEFNPNQTLTSGERAGDSPYRSGFAYLWDMINDHRATWKSNPFVWVISFRGVVSA